MSYSVACPGCKREVPLPVKCGTCHGVWYCSQKCLQTHEPFHKTTCRAPASSPGEVKQFSGQTFEWITAKHDVLGAIYSAWLRRQKDPGARVVFEIWQDSLSYSIVYRLSPLAKYIAANPAKRAVLEHRIRSHDREKVIYIHLTRLDEANFHSTQLAFGGDADFRDIPPGAARGEEDRFEVLQGPDIADPQMVELIENIKRLSVKI